MSLSEIMQGVFADDTVAFPQANFDAVIIYNFSNAGSGFIIKNNTFKYGRRYGALVKGENGLIEGNNFIDMGSSAICASSELGSFCNGPTTSGLKIINNKIFCGTGARAAIYVSFAGNKLGERMQKNIVVEGNEITGFGPNGAMYFEYVDGLSFKNNIVTAPKQNLKVKPIVNILNCGNISIDGFTINDNRETKAPFAIQMSGCDVDESKILNITSNIEKYTIS